MPQTRTNTEQNSRQIVRVDEWYVNTYGITGSGWSKFYYGDYPNSNEPIHLCGNTKLIQQKEQNGYIGFRVSGGNIQATLQNRTAIRFQNEAEVKLVWKLEDNVKKHLTRTKPNNFGKKAVVVVEVDYGNIKSEIPLNKTKKWLQLFASMKYNNKIVEITLNSSLEDLYVKNNFFNIILKTGTYKILSPDYSHARDTNGALLAGQYVVPNQYPNMKNYDVWFPIEYRNPQTNRVEVNRYIHPGQISEGCVTIHNMHKWNDLYDYLISHRESHSNGKYIGDIIVKEKR